jgi:integral membrane protein
MTQAVAVQDAKTVSLQRALRWYRVMAFTTGTVLLAGTIALALKYGAHVKTPGYFYLWMGHGWLYLLYVVAGANLGMKMRWSLIRLGLVLAAGTVPTASFIAEHYVTRDTRGHLSV